MVAPHPETTNGWVPRNDPCPCEQASWSEEVMSCAKNCQLKLWSRQLVPEFSSRYDLLGSAWRGQRSCVKPKCWVFQTGRNYRGHGSDSHPYSSHSFSRQKWLTLRCAGAVSDRGGTSWPVPGRPKEGDPAGTRPQVSAA